MHKKPQKPINKKPKTKKTNTFKKESLIKIEIAVKKLNSCLTPAKIQPSIKKRSEKIHQPLIIKLLINNTIIFLKKKSNNKPPFKKK